MPAVEYYARVTRRISGPIGSTVCIRVRRCAAPRTFFPLDLHRVPNFRDPARRAPAAPRPRRARRPALEEEGAPIRLHDFEVRPLPPPPPALPCARRPPEVVQALVRGQRQHQRSAAPPPFGPRTKWTRRVPHPVLIGHVSSLPRAGAARYPAAARRAARILAVIGRLLLAAALKGRDADRLAAPPRTTKPTDPRSGCAPFPAVRQRSLTSVRAPAGGGTGTTIRSARRTSWRCGWTPRRAWCAAPASLGRARVLGPERVL